jgi:hypothetical protein
MSCIFSRNDDQSNLKKTEKLKTNNSKWTLLTFKMTITDTHTHLYSEEFDQIETKHQKSHWIKVFLVLFLQSTLPALRQCMI